MNPDSNTMGVRVAPDVKLGRDVKMFAFVAGRFRFATLGSFAAGKLWSIDCNDKVANNVGVVSFDWLCRQWIPMG